MPNIIRNRSVSATMMGLPTVVLMMLALVMVPPPVVAAEFFRSVEDLPLAPGLTEVVDEGVEFDSPAGRIVTAVASGDVRPEAVRAFYRKALPPLGWIPAPGGAYRRDGEVLTFVFENAEKAVKLRVRVVPALQKPPR